MGHHSLCVGGTSTQQLALGSPTSQIVPGASTSWFSDYEGASLNIFYRSAASAINPDCYYCSPENLAYSQGRVWNHPSAVWEAGIRPQWTVVGSHERLADCYIYVFSTLYVDIQSVEFYAPTRHFPQHKAWFSWVMTEMFKMLRNQSGFRPYWTVAGSLETWQQGHMIIIIVIVTKVIIIRGLYEPPRIEERCQKI